MTRWMLSFAAAAPTLLLLHSPHATVSAFVVVRNKNVHHCRSFSVRIPTVLRNGVNSLTDDGDFLLVGINNNNDDNAPNQAEGGVGVGVGVGSGLDDVSLGNALRISDADSSIDMKAVSRFLEGGGRGGGPSSSVATSADDSISVSVDGYGYGDDEMTEEVTVIIQWLRSIIPTLNETDTQRYARSLFEIGFAPTCVTQCELTWDDLSFMKLLHRRYLYKEIIGEAHPWDP